MAHFTDLAFLHLFFENDLVARRDVGDIVQRLFVILAPGIGVIGILLIVEGHAGADDIQHGNAVVRHGSLEQFLHLLGVAGKGTRDEGCVGGQRFHADIHRHVLVGALLLEGKSLLSSGGELALGQSIHAVVLHDVDHVHIAAHDMLELAHADAGCVAIAGDADAFQGVIAEERAGRNGWHASVQAVEAEGAVQEVGGAFARTADAAELDDVLRHDVHLIHCADDLVRDRVVSAALAECAGVSAVIIFCKTGKIHICGRASHGEWLSHKYMLLSSSAISCADSALAGLPSCILAAYFARMPSRTHFAEAGMPSPYATDLKFSGFFGIFNGQDLVHLAIAVHFHDEDLIVFVDEFSHFLCEGHGADAQEICLDAVLVFQADARLPGWQLRWSQNQ